MKTTRFLLLPLAAAATLAATAAAGHPLVNAPTEHMLGLDFTALDRDSDGLLSRSELPADHALIAAFDAHDRDGDTHISREEYEMFLAGDGGNDAADDTALSQQDEGEAEPPVPMQ